MFTEPPRPTSVKPWTGRQRKIRPRHRPRGSVSAVRIFVVVAKSRPDLYQYFTTGFAGVEGVEVILDRRIGEPAAGSGEALGERRNARNIYDELEIRGFVIVRLPG
jgi:hypothetical protein